MLENEMAKEVELVVSRDGHVKLKDIVTQLNMYGYNLKGAEIYFYSNGYEEYVKCSADHDSKFIPITVTEFGKNILELKVIFKEEEKKPADTKIEKSKQGRVIGQKRKKPEVARLKSRITIEQIMLKVKEWNIFYKQCGSREGKNN
eukprot:TRINITY_DN24781_c0_g3_i1.p1 TRINITY_DN24781_c0_g3~~TRINITY_DN24781_c0_g3_i1.p1  ORF type:complete len:146 (+),score=30.38 TRINITY_DN24781_c0_g3_i1:92-529(+)